MRQRANKQAGGIIAWSLLWIVGIALVAFVTLDYRVPQLQANLKAQVVSAVAGVGVPAPEVTIDGRDVILRGVAENAEILGAAVLAAGNVAGIRRVDNQMTLQPVGVLERPQFSLITTDAGITLSGRLPTTKSAELLEAGVRQSFPADPLTSNLMVDAATSEPVWLETVLHSLGSLKLVTIPQLQITGDMVRIAGIVDNEATENLIVDDLGQLFQQPMALINQLEIQISTPLLNPELTLRQQGDRLVIAGVLRTLEQAEKIASRAMTTFRINKIENQLRTDPNAGDAIWFSAALQLLPALGRLQDLNLSINRDAMTIEGQAGTVQERDALLIVVDQTVGGLLAIEESITVPPLAESAESVAAFAAMEPDMGSAQAQTDMGTLLDAINLAGVEFQTDSAELNADSKRILSDMAKILVRFPTRVVSIIGHTDSLSADMVTLNQSRAQAVRQYLLEKGIPADQLQSFGSDGIRPNAEITPSSGRTGNQGVQFNYK